MYRSVVVARPGVPARRLSMTSREPGWRSTGPAPGRATTLLRAHLAEAGRFDPFFGSVTETGSHADSIDRLQAGEADCAAIDCSVWEDRVGRDARARELQIVTRTRDYPAPPFSVSRALDPGVRRAIADALLASRPSGLDGIVAASVADYEPLRRAIALAGQVAW